MADTKDIWQLLEESAPRNCEAIQDLYSWSLNFNAGKGPFTLFLDLIGYTAEEFGDDFGGLYDMKTRSLSYLEIDKLAAALSEYADNPYDVNEYIQVLMNAEMSS